MSHKTQRVLFHVMASLLIFGVIGLIAALRLPEKIERA